MTFVLYEPSFVSEWYEAVADNQSLASLTINHNLGEYPVKVDVQVKITEGGQDYIFSGLGSSQNDDDYPYDYGGVIYRYNDRCVQLAYPFNNNGYSVSRGLGFTGFCALYLCVFYRCVCVYVCNSFFLLNQMTSNDLTIQHLISFLT